MKIKTCKSKDYESVFEINRKFNSLDEFFECLGFERKVIKPIRSNTNFEVQPRTEVNLCPWNTMPIKIDLSDLNEYYNKTKR